MLMRIDKRFVELLNEVSGNSISWEAFRTAYDQRVKEREATNPKRPFSGSAKIARNAPCPCGSGLKYKKCCIIGPEEERNFNPDNDGPF